MNKTRWIQAMSLLCAGVVLAGCAGNTNGKQEDIHTSAGTETAKTDGPADLLKTKHRMRSTEADCL